MTRGCRSIELDLLPTPNVRFRRWRRGREVEAWPVTEHRALEVAIVHQGTVGYSVGVKDLAAEPGTAIVVPAFVGHAGAIRPWTRATSIHLGIEMTSEIAAAMERPLPVDAMALPVSLRLATLIELLESEANSSDPGARLAADALVEAIAVELLRTARAEDCAHDVEEARRPSDPRILAALQRIETEFAEPLSVEALAATARMSRYHFSRAFCREVGQSPYRCLLEVRLARAAEHLRSGRTSVTEAALSTGFTDLGRFSRAFRRKMGTSPAEYARIRRARRAG